MSKNDADEAVSVVSLTSSSGGYINGRNSANLELLIDKTSSKQIAALVEYKLKNHATCYDICKYQSNKSITGTWLVQ